MYADNNAEAIFKQDSREKKTIGHSAAKRVGKRKRVTFPSDYLSAKELKRMNGDVKNYRLDQPIVGVNSRQCLMTCVNSICLGSRNGILLQTALLEK